MTTRVISNYFGPAFFRTRFCLPHLLSAFLMACLGLCIPASAQISPGTPANQWVPISYSGNFPDPSLDQQTGSTESDIVGNSNQPSLFMKFNDGGSPITTNGYFGIRLRVGADQSPPGFKGAAFVGLDANNDGKLDIFVGVNNQGSGDVIGIWNPGVGANISPSTTTLVSPPSKSYTETAGNYSWLAVSATSDPTAINYDLNADTKTDQFLSFVIPFSDIVAALAARGITGFTRDSSMTLVAATATQDNSLNEDLNGVVGGINSATTWQALGALSETYSPNGTGPIPEPGTLSLVGLGATALLLGSRKRISG
jgi:hypothetical protein